MALQDTQLKMLGLIKNYGHGASDPAILDKLAPILTLKLRSWARAVLGLEPAGELVVLLAWAPILMLLIVGLTA